MSSQRVINQFMWGFQPHFRTSVQTATRMAFEAVGFTSKAHVILVGFQVAGEHAFPICIEPETGPYTPTDLAHVSRTVEERYLKHPEHEIWNSNPRVHELRHASLKKQIRAEVVAETLSAHAASSGISFFASMPGLVGDYEVHVVIGVNNVALDAVARLQTTLRDRMRVAPSFVHALLDEILSRAAAQLYQPDPGAGLNALGAGTPEVVRGATERLVRSALLCADFMFGQDTDLLLNSLSALPYEGRSGLGNLLIVKPDSTAANVMLRLEVPVSLRNTRAVRKLLEACGEDVGLLTGELRGSFGGSVYALGKIRDTYNPASETAFVVSILGRGAWDLLHDGRVLLSVRDGVSRLPVQTLDTEILRDVAERILPSADLDRLVVLAKAVEQNDHGAMLVISSDAAAEAKRLSPQAWSIEATDLMPSLASQLTAMDGAVLVDPQGRCHAIGVILDGHADKAGDPARGSRYNNTIRYMGSGPPACVIIVYSADGTVDIFPRLMPRVGRKQVSNAVERYLLLAAERPPNLEWVSDARDDLESLRFYLSQSQCDSINTAFAAVNEWRLQDHGMQLIEDDWVPHPDMNDSYWLD